MGLSGHEIGMQIAVELNEFGEMPVGRCSRHMQSDGGQAFAVGVVDLEAMTMALTDIGGAIGIRDYRPGHERRGVGAQPHGAAQVSPAGDELALGIHGGHHRVGRLRLHLRR